MIHLYYHTIPDSALATVIYEDGTTENFWACINNAGFIDYLESLKPNDKRAGEHNRLYVEHLSLLPIREIKLTLKHEVELEASKGE